MRHQENFSSKHAESAWKGQLCGSCIRCLGHASSLAFTSLPLSPSHYISPHAAYMYISVYVVLSHTDACAPTPVCEYICIYKSFFSFSPHLSQSLAYIPYSSTTSWIKRQDLATLRTRDSLNPPTKYVNILFFTNFQWWK